MCWIFLFPVAVISMILLLMTVENGLPSESTPVKYENDRHTLKKNMARGRCGLPGLPNKNFFKTDEAECKAEEEKEPLEKEMKVLRCDLHDQRKQIEETKERMVDADKQLLSLNTTAIGMRKKYDMIMHVLKEDLLDAEEEYKILNKKMASANDLRQKFYSLDNECENLNNKEKPAASCLQKPSSSCAEKSAPSCAEKSDSRRPCAGISKPQPKPRLGSCCKLDSSNSRDYKSTDITPYSAMPSVEVHQSRSSYRQSSYAKDSFSGDASVNSYQSPSSYLETSYTNNYNQSSDSGNPSNKPADPCNKYPRPPCCPPPKPPTPPPPPPNPCHPPIHRPKRTECERPGAPFCCKYPAAPDYGFPPVRCPHDKQSLDDYLNDNETGSLSSSLRNSNNNETGFMSSLAVRKTSQSVRNSNFSSLINRGTRNSFMTQPPSKSCCSNRDNASKTSNMNTSLQRGFLGVSSKVSPKRANDTCCPTEVQPPRNPCCPNQETVSRTSNMDPFVRKGSSRCSSNVSPQRANDTCCPTEVQPPRNPCCPNQDTVSRTSNMDPSVRKGSSRCSSNVSPQRANDTCCPTEVQPPRNPCCPNQGTVSRTSNMDPSVSSRCSSNVSPQRANDTCCPTEDQPPSNPCCSNRDTISRTSNMGPSLQGGSSRLLSNVSPQRANNTCCSPQVQPPSNPCCSNRDNISRTSNMNPSLQGGSSRLLSKVSPQRAHNGCCSSEDQPPRNPCCSSQDNVSITSSRCSSNVSPKRTDDACCSSNKSPSLQRSSTDVYESMRQSEFADNGSFAGRQSSKSSCCSTGGKPDPCAPPTYCPGRSACACCKCEPPVPKCPPSKLIKKPPYSTFFDERMPIKQCAPEETDDDEEEQESVSQDTKEDRCKFPPKCCMSVYEDYLKKTRDPPKVTLPVFIDPCDPCAEVPREISPFEDVVNISHTCGTQTNNGEPKSDEKCCPSYPLGKQKIIP